MTDRSAEPQVVCPFVAFDDDRDFRAPVPDHRHRCFAETPAAPRALAHQAAYCLSSSFASCPTFADWARREAAPVRQESPVRSLRDTAATPRSGAVPGSPASAPTGSKGALPPAEGWAAPPVPPAVPAPALDADPAAVAGAASVVGAAATASELPPAAGEPPAAPAAAPAFLAGRSTRPPAPAAPPTEDEAWAPPSDEPMGVDDDRHGEPEPSLAEPRRAPVGYAPVAASRTDQRPVAGGAGRAPRERHDPAAPSWEEPRRFEAYPAIKSGGRGGLPRPLLYALVVLVVGVGLFAAPFILRGIGGGDGGDVATPLPSASVEPAATPAPTAEPTPEQVVYTVKANDTLSKIAAQFGLTVEQVQAANPQITNPNQIAVGDQIVIPPTTPDEIDGSVTPAP